MGLDCTKGNQNIYFQARKRAAEYNDRLGSREGAAEILGVSPSTLADYELGITKVVPVDKVVLMADIYNSPELKNNYCKNECPIGKGRPMATSVSAIEGTALRLLDAFDVDEIEGMNRKIIKICKDGVITEEEKPALLNVVMKLDAVMESVSEMKLLAEKELGGN